MSTPAKDPIAAAEMPADWIATVREIAQREGYALRAGGRVPTVTVTFGTPPAALLPQFWIEGQNINRPDEWQPLMLPNSGVLFATAADRDAVLGALQAPQARS